MWGYLREKRHDSAFGPAFRQGGMVSSEVQYLVLVKWDKAATGHPHPGKRCVFSLP
jgi:hypothetical protein